MSAPIAPESPATVAVAFSGGRDSLALLHATVHSASAFGLQVVALHVHHGLQDEADAWLATAQALCSRWRRRGLPLRLRWHLVDDKPAPGDSLEAWARGHRHDALARMAREAGASLLLLAHHRQDQAETVLLQALRGAGPRGLAAMPASIVRDGITWARPWLHLPRADIEAYVRRYRLRPIEDPSNQDPRLARNRLRLQVWPALLDGFEGAEVALGHVAERAHEADAALIELADLDLAHRSDPTGLDMLALSTLSVARQANALRAWLGRGMASPPPNTLVRRLLAEAGIGKTAQWPAGTHHVLRLYRGRLQLEPLHSSLIGPMVQRVDLSAPGRVAVPSWRGHFEVTRASGPAGVPMTLALRAQLRPRTGGEKFQRTPKGVARSLKKQYQSAGISADLRAGPLVWLDGRLVYVPGLGIDARWWSDHGQALVTWHWHADSA